MLVTGAISGYTCAILDCSILVRTHTVIRSDDKLRTQAKVFQVLLPPSGQYCLHCLLMMMKRVARRTKIPKTAICRIRPKRRMFIPDQRVSCNWSGFVSFAVTVDSITPTPKHWMQKERISNDTKNGARYLAGSQSVRNPRRVSGVTQ